jgi:hypothetical protein
MTNPEPIDAGRPITAPDDLPAVRPFYKTWRVSWWRAHWAEPRRAEFGLLADAEKFARDAAVHVTSKAGGRVVRVQIEERIITSWKVIHEREPRPGAGSFSSWRGMPTGHGVNDDDGGD